MPVALTPRASKQLQKLPRLLQSKIIPSLEKLSRNSHPPQSKKLTGINAWRLRIGDYRIIYKIDVENITVLTIAHRREVYKI